jgi:vacuolar-type H+-ATPase subunit H
MRDVIEKIIATESEAKLVVDAARTEADQILSEARKKGRDVIEKARQEALVEAEKILEIAVETAERDKQQRLADAAAEIESKIQLEPASRKSAVEGVVRCVCKQQ